MHNIRKYIKLIENETDGYYYVGNCINSFDEDDGEYIAGDKLERIECLGIIDEELIDDALENSSDSNLINTNHFNYLKGYIPNLEKDSVLVYSDKYDVYVIYNPEEDVHYIYE